MTTISNYKCLVCDNPMDKNETTCPVCGNEGRKIITLINEGVQVLDMCAGGMKSPRYSGKHKFAFEFLSGKNLFIKENRYVDKARTIDRIEDLYVEKVTDPLNGEQLHYKNEPLSKHQKSSTRKKKH